MENRLGLNDDNFNILGNNTMSPNDVQDLGDSASSNHGLAMDRRTSIYGNQSLASSIGIDGNTEQQATDEGSMAIIAVRESRRRRRPICEETDANRVAHRRRMNAVHSSRKRMRSRQDEETLRQTAQLLSQQNLEIFHQNMQLEKLLQHAHEMSAWFEGHPNELKAKEVSKNVKSDSCTVQQNQANTSIHDSAMIEHLANTDDDNADDSAQEHNAIFSKSTQPQPPQPQQQTLISQELLHPHIPVLDYTSSFCKHLTQPTANNSFVNALPNPLSIDEAMPTYLTSPNQHFLRRALEFDNRLPVSSLSYGSGTFSHHGAGYSHIGQNLSSLSAQMPLPMMSTPLISYSSLLPTQHLPLSSTIRYNMPFLWSQRRSENMHMLSRMTSHSLSGGLSALSGGLPNILTSPVNNNYYQQLPDAPSSAEFHQHQVTEQPMSTVSLMAPRRMMNQLMSLEILNKHQMKDTTK
jgi:hypothetical protein